MGALFDGLGILGAVVVGFFVLAGLGALLSTEFVGWVVFAGYHAFWILVGVAVTAFAMKMDNGVGCALGLVMIGSAIWHAIDSYKEVRKK